MAINVNQDQCSTIRSIFDQLHRFQRQIPQVVKEARELGFGTAETADVIRRTIDYLKVLNRVPKPAWSVLYKFVRCDNKALAELTVADLKVLVEVFVFPGLVELGAGSQIADLQADADQLLATAVHLMTVCGFPWPSKNALKFYGSHWEDVTL